MSLLHRICFRLGTACLLIITAAGCGGESNSSIGKGAKESDCVTAYIRGESLRAAGKYQLAADEFSRVLANGPPVKSPGREDSYYMWSLYSRGIAYLEGGSTEKAVDDLSAFLRRKPLSADALFKRGLAYLKLGFPDTAVEDFSAALGERPDDADTYLQRAIAYRELNHDRSAIDDCTSSIRLKPNNAEAYRVRGEAYLDRAEYQLAISSLERCIVQGGAADKVTPLLSQAYAQRSKGLTTAGKTAEALKLAQKAQALDPTFVPFPGPDTPPEVHAKPPLPEEPPAEQEVESLVNVGDDLFDKKDYEGAHKAFTDAIAKSPHRADLYEKRAANSLVHGFADSAQFDIERAIQVGGYTPERYRLKAWILLGVHDNYGAVETANYLLRQGPIDAEALGIRGTAYLGRNLLDEAIRDLSYAIEKDPSLEGRLKPTLAEAYYRRSLSRKHAGRWKEYQADVDRAQELGWIIET
jgi:tetratricopeptide (TPR) repeat protein